MPTTPPPPTARTARCVGLVLVLTTSVHCSTSAPNGAASEPSSSTTTASSMSSSVSPPSTLPTVPVTAPPTAPTVTNSSVPDATSTRGDVGASSSADIAASEGSTDAPALSTGAASDESATMSDDGVTSGSETPYVDPAPRPAVTAAEGATLVKVEADKPLQGFEGWGTSLCWWANRVGGWDEAKRDAFLDVVTDPVDGLGYNVFRYNIGGGENPAHDHMDAFRDMPGFQPTAGNWDWDADARQTGVVRYLAGKGDHILLEAFSNSPPYWMTISGCASGSADGSNNLKEDAYDAFADYLTEVVKHFRDQYGVTFRTLEPLNEPNANWWKADGSQEGCHFGPSNQERIIVAVGTQLVAKGLTETSVSASDENSLDDAYNNLRGFSAETFSHVSQLNVHSYNGSKRKEVLDLAKEKQKRLWQSESGPLSVDLATELDAALFMAGRVITDLRELQPAAWVDWQIQDPAASWSSFTYNDNAQSFAPRKRYYMHAGFSRYIRPGATFVTVGNADMVAAISPDYGYVTLVARNGDKTASRKFTFDLTPLRVRPTEAKVYRTSADEDLAELAPIATEAWSLTATLPPYSVTTFVFELAP